MEVRPAEVRPATGALEPDIDSAALRHAAHESISSSSIERFCLVGDIATHLRRLRELQRMGIDCYTLYLNHDAARETVGAYASEMLPEFRR